MRPALLVVLAFACHSAKLHGTAPKLPVVAPDFVAHNSDGAARGKADLLGHPTVLWFYPAAATPG